MGICVFYKRHLFGFVLTKSGCGLYWIYKENRYVAYTPLIIFRVGMKICHVILVKGYKLSGIRVDDPRLSTHSITVRRNLIIITLLKVRHNPRMSTCKNSCLLGKNIVPKFTGVQSDDVGLLGARGGGG